jgi:hypothetical protein
MFQPSPQRGVCGNLSCWLLCEYRARYAHSDALLVARSPAQLLPNIRLAVAGGDAASMRTEVARGGQRVTNRCGRPLLAAR